MSKDSHDISYQLKAASAFSRQSRVFDKIYSNDGIITYKRRRVRAVLASLLKPASYVLELNSGTGEDAVWLAQNGHRVHATDISDGMQEVLTKKISGAGLDHSVSAEICSFNQLEELKVRGPFDCVFSNFAGLNCTGDLVNVIKTFDRLLAPGGVAVLVLLPRFCLWESLLLLRGKCKTATRRWFARSAVAANVEGVRFPCWYYNPSDVKKAFGPKYKLERIEGLCSIVPPSYIEHFDNRHPSIYRRLCKIEDRWKNRWPWRSIGDYFIVSYRKKI